MNRLVALPLILMLLVGTSLPHGHGNPASVDAGGLTARPHVHLSGKHDHHHHGEGGHTHSPHGDKPSASDQEVSDAGGTPTAFQRPEHHHDAIYLADFTSTGRLPDTQKQADAVGFAVDSPAGHSLGAHLRSQSRVDRFDRSLSLFGTLPIYLAHAALRL